MENNQDLIEALNEEEEEILNEIQDLKKNMTKRIQRIRVTNDFLISSSHSLCTIYVCVFSAMFVALGSEQDFPSWESLVMNIKPSNIITSIQDRDMEAQPLNSYQIAKIKSLFKTFPNITQYIRDFTIFGHFVSNWVETYVEISLKVQRILVIRNKLMMI